MTDKEQAEGRRRAIEAQSQPMPAWHWRCMIGWVYPIHFKEANGRWRCYCSGQSYFV